MDRKTLLSNILALEAKNIILVLPTGTGKSKIAVELCKKNKANTILIVIPKLVLIDNWKEELKKWKYKNKVEFSTYVGLNKKADNKYDCIILDECHHITDRSAEFLYSIDRNHIIGLSATLPSDKKELLDTIADPEYYYLSTKQAIENEILPDPKVYLMPLILDNKIKDQVYIKHPKGKGIVECDYLTRFRYLSVKGKQIHIKCTKKQYVDLLSADIQWYKNRYMITKNIIFKNQWLNLAGKRLQYLAHIKNDEIKKILNRLSDKRVLTFCATIEQTEALGKNCINSKNENSATILKDFNEGKIKHITSCNIINEGINLADCQVGVYANLNSSETIITQRTGRILRHKEPEIILPYYVGTREEEIKNSMLENYNPELIFKYEDYH